LAVVFLLSAASASAWEFELEGSFNWYYEFYTQLGRRGFFGPYNSDNSLLGGAENLNFWNGGRFDTQITSSAQAGWSYFNVELFPKIIVNPAIRLQAKYRLGTYGDPKATDYHTFEAPGTNVTLSEGHWTMFWGTVQTPVGILGIGKRPWNFGTGLQYDGDDSASTESIALVAPNGPLDIGIAFYPYRFAGSSSIERLAAYDPYVSDISSKPPFNYYDFPIEDKGGSAVNGQYYSRADSSGTLGKDLMAFLVYYKGPLNIGLTGSFLEYHIGREAVLRNPQNPADAPTPLALDSQLFHGSAYVKFINGPLFLNGEAAWVYWSDRWSGPADVLGGPSSRDVEQWRYVVELGIITGPTKVSFINAWTPGPDRRAGTLIGKQPAAFVWHRTFDRMHGNYDEFRPYSYIFSYDYGSGLYAYNLNGNGFLRDAFVLAARVDYAVAANLYIFGSFFYANRTSNGYSWGCIGPNAGAGTSGFQADPDGNISIKLNRYGLSPNIPDSSLGYEVDLGFNWKLLENLTASFVLGYWNPGKWFNYACIDRSVRNWQDGTVTNNWGTRPGRSLDPILGGNFCVKMDF